MHTSLPVLRFWRRAQQSLIFALAGTIATAWAAPSAEDTVRASVQPYVADHSIAGAVIMVANAQDVLFHEALGMMDLAKQQPMRKDAMFWVASQTKPITAAGVMILVDDGKIGLDDPIEKYLPEFKNLWVKKKLDENQMVLGHPNRSILVRDLLAHTSGLPPYGSMEKPPVYDQFPLEVRTAGYAGAPLETEPGQVWAYSNAGYNTLGRLIEVASGKSYAEFMDERIFRPLGMVDTTFWPNDEQVSRLAKSYKSEADGLVETPIHMFRYPLASRERQAFPGGGLFSTAKDLSLFYRMLVNDGAFAGQRILSAESVKLMTMDQTGVAKHAYGFGFHLRKNNFGHAGAYGSNTVYDRETRLITVFLVQQAVWKKGVQVDPGFQKAAAAGYSSPRK